MRGQNPADYPHGHPELACKNYHPRIPANVIYEKGGTKIRCRVCRNADEARGYAVRKQARIEKQWAALPAQTLHQLHKTYLILLAKRGIKWPTTPAVAKSSPPTESSASPVPATGCSGSTAAYCCSSLQFSPDAA